MCHFKDCSDYSGSLEIPCYSLMSLSVSAEVRGDFSVDDLHCAGGPQGASTSASAVFQLTDGECVLTYSGVAFPSVALRGCQCLRLALLVLNSFLNSLPF